MFTPSQCKWVVSVRPEFAGYKGRQRWHALSKEEREGRRRVEREEWGRAIQWMSKYPRRSREDNRHDRSFKTEKEQIAFYNKIKDKVPEGLVVEKYERAGYLSL